MARIIDGTLYERNKVPGWFQVRTKRVSGVMERTISPCYELVDAGPAPAWMLTPNEPLYAADGKTLLDPERDAEWVAEEKEKNLRRAAKRAKLACKWFIVHERFDEVLTLTYRENQTDEALAKKHHKEWVRRMKAALGGVFRYCTGFEPQKRGAWHMHVATHKLPEHVEHKGVKIQAWKLGTMIWRDIVGADNGLCFVGGKPSRWGAKRRKNMGLYKMANYVSKYITKHYELMPESVNRYSRSNGRARWGTADDVRAGRADLEVEVVRFGARNVGELITLCFEQAELSEVVAHRLSMASEFWLLATEAKPPGR
jgi:hypothetical protein